MRYSIRYYHTFSDLRNGNEKWSDVIGYTNESTESEISNKLLTDFLIPRYDDLFVDITSTETSNFESVKRKMYSWLNSTYPYYSKLISLFESEEDNLMSKLISTSTRDLENVRTGGNTNTLTAGTQRTTSRENDTPQNGGLFEDDEHTSSISTYEADGYQNTYTLNYNNQKIADTGTVRTEVEPDTIINRLNDIRNKYTNFYERWCEDFTRFIYNPGIFEEGRAGNIYNVEE